MNEVVLLNLSYYIPLSTKALARGLKKEGILCDILDFSDAWDKVSMDRKRGTFDPRDFPAFISEVRKDLEKHQKEYSRFKFFGVSFYDWEGEKNITFPVSRLIKELFPKAYLIGGGPAFNTNPKGFFSAAKLDYAITGEGENALPALVKALMTKDFEGIRRLDGVIQRKNGRIILPQKKAMLTHEEIANSPIIYTVEGNGWAITYTERGCSNACVYCSVPRKGRPVPIKDEVILAGLRDLAKKRHILTIHFADDQLFFDRERTFRLFGKIRAEGLCNRFSFTGLATINSFIHKGKVDMELIAFLKKAHFIDLAIGTEALNDNILKELKSGRYSAIEAMKVNDALNRVGIKTSHFMLAGGIETRARDFLESYYRGLARGLRHHGDYNQPSFVQAFKGTGLYEKGLKENALFTQRGRPFRGTSDRSTTAAFVVPKDPLLREVFLKNLRKGRKNINQYDAEQMIELSKALDKRGENFPGMTRRLQKQLGVILQFGDEKTNAYYNFYTKSLDRELKKSGFPETEGGLKKLLSNPAVKQRILTEAKTAARHYVNEKEKVSRMRGISRLRQISKMRQKFGFGMEVPIRFNPRSRK